MANIFEELMLSHAKLTESLKAQKKQPRCKCKKYSNSKFRVESLRIFEEADPEELDAEFAVDPDEADESEDEVVLIIDPELPTDEEVPEDAAEDLIGDYVYKCPVCGANYVCGCDAVETEAIEVDEEGVPTECPVCGDDSDQILVGEIAPADEAEGEEEQEMEPVESEDEEEESSEETTDEGGEEEVSEEEEEEITEESLRRRRRRKMEAARRRNARNRYGRRRARESVDVEVKVDEDDNTVVVATDFDDADTYDAPYADEAEVYEDEAEIDDVELGDPVEVEESRRRMREARARRRAMANRRIRKESVARRPITKTTTRRPVARNTRAIQESKARTRRPATKTASRPFTFKEAKFESLMTKMIRENYNTRDAFKVTRAYLSGGKLNLNYTIGNRRGTFVAEGFDKKATKMKLRVRDRGVFTESYTKTPSFVVECVCVNKAVIPMRIRYNFTKKVKEQLYRIRGEVK